MPLYNATIVMTLKITKQIPVRGRNEDAARARVDEMISNTHFGALSWEVFEDHSANGWEEDELNVSLEDIEEE